MRPALKFLKHHPRGLKHVKHGHVKHATHATHATHGKGLPETVHATIGTKRLTPLKFKNIRLS